jgi:FkbM family methyltransferase
MVKPGMTVVEIGAAEGYYALTASRLVGDTGKVYAFEPFPKSFELLARNVRRNGARNIILEQKAVCDKIGMARLYLSRKDPLKNSLGTGRTETDRFIEVETTTLDAYFGNERVNFIKMNIEGSEPLVLRGMQNVLTHSPDLRILAEYDPTNLTGLGLTEEEYLQELLKHFSLHVVHMRQDTLLPYSGIEQVRKCLSRIGDTHLIGTRKEPQ